MYELRTFEVSSEALNLLGNKTFEVYPRAGEYVEEKSADTDYSITSS